MSFYSRGTAHGRENRSSGVSGGLRGPDGMWQPLGNSDKIPIGLVQGLQEFKENMLFQQAHFLHLITQ